ncbi:hypothetical protein TorRG33x02_233280 [Trema orientale]|uniref:Uncharacterized protein n=1 Tax=Trema orientale TaxID=63057 RepID=A0A2P5E5M8_TREOI|nr:hypothetical protein TorRG33x02_233280 [Trema orientale]
MKELKDQGTGSVIQLLFPTFADFRWRSSTSNYLTFEIFARTYHGTRKLWWSTKFIMELLKIGEGEAGQFTKISVDQSSAKRNRRIYRKISVTRFHFWKVFSAVEFGIWILKIK